MSDNDHERKTVAAHDMRQHTAATLGLVIRDMYHFHMNHQTDKLLDSMVWIHDTLEGFFTEENKEALNNCQEELDEASLTLLRLKSLSQGRPQGLQMAMALERRKLLQARRKYHRAIMKSLKDARLLLPFYEDDEGAFDADSFLSEGGL